MRTPQKPEEQRHDGVSNLLSTRHIDMNEAAEAEVGSECGINGAVRGAEAEDELPWTKPALGGAWEEGEGVEEDSGGGLDPSLGEAAERNVFDGGDAGQAFLLQVRVLDAVESYY